MSVDNPHYQYHQSVSEWQHNTKMISIRPAEKVWKVGREADWLTKVSVSVPGAAIFLVSHRIDFGVGGSADPC